MDRRGKQRLIGAVILVALAVVVVPELLSGSKLQAPAAAASAQFPPGAPQPVRNVTMVLAGADGRPAEGRPSESGLLAANSAQPPPASMPAPQTAPVPQTAPAPAPAAATVAAPVPTTPAPASAHPGHTAGLAQAPAPLESAAASPTYNPGFAVQLGSFANRGNADKLLHQLEAQGYAAYVSAEGAGAAARYRVRVGPLSDRDSAEKTMAKLKASGHDSTLIAPR